MKKFIILFIASLMILACSIGEGISFSFRNDVHFGDSLIEVQEKEESKGQVVPMDFECNALLYSRITLSGIEKSSLQYSFSDADAMTAIHIRYNKDGPRSKKLENHQSDYSIIDDGLHKKYGASIEYSDLSELKRYRGSSIAFYYGAQDYEILEASQWILPYDDTYSLYIDHTLIQQNKSTPEYLHRLTYMLVTPDSLLEEDIVQSDL